jgi:hypothetical protein
MDCNHARLLLEVAHPIATELDARDTEQLAAHLASCPDCGALAESDRLADEQLAKVMRDVPVPDGFKLRLLNRLNGDRDAWWRARFIRAAGVAAALLLAVGLAYAAWWSKKPAPNMHDFQQQVEARIDSGDRLVEEFKARNFDTAAPRKFDYDLLRSFGMANFQGKQVPHLLFVKDNVGGGNRSAIANVYVLSDSQFDFADLRNQPVLTGSHNNIMVMKDDNNPRFMFVVVWSSWAGPTPAVFFRPNRPDA